MEGEVVGVGSEGVAELVCGGFELALGGVEGGVAEELLDFDDVGSAFEGGVAKVWRRAWTRAPGGPGSGCRCGCRAVR